MILKCVKCRGILMLVDSDSYVCQTDPAHRYQALYLNPNAPEESESDEPEILQLRVPSPPPLPNGAMRPSALPPPIVQREACCNHPGKPSETACSLCGAGICGTCTFDLPSGYRLCPECVCAEPTKSLSSQRLAAAIASGVLAGVSILGFALGGLFSGSGSDDLEAVAGLAWLAASVAVIAGVACGAGALSRRHGNPWFTWAALIVNVVIVGIIALFMLMGILMGGLA